jgi:hypothetical protein
MAEERRSVVYREKKREEKRLAAARGRRGEGARVFQRER